MTISKKDVELEMRIHRLELMLREVVKAFDSPVATKLWYDTKDDVIRLFPESRVA